MRRLGGIVIAVIVIVVVAVVAAVALHARAPADPLAGTSWKITMVDPAGKSAPDTLTFEKGRFDSSACRAYGFGAADYAVARKGGALTFTALTKSPKEGIMNWQGKVQGDRISGTSLWTSKQGKEMVYKFSGKRA